MSVLVEGPLRKKKSTALGGYNKHWFRLTQAGGLVYYKDASAPKPADRPAGSIDISRGKYIRVATTQANAIEIVIDDRTYMLIAESVEDRNVWLKGLSKWQQTARDNITSESVARLRSLSSRAPADVSSSSSSSSSNLTGFENNANTTPTTTTTNNNNNNNNTNTNSTSASNGRHSNKLSVSSIASVSSSSSSNSVRSTHSDHDHTATVLTSIFEPAGVGGGLDSENRTEEAKVEVDSKTAAVIKSYERPLQQLRNSLAALQRQLLDAGVSSGDHHLIHQHITRLVNMMIGSDASRARHRTEQSDLLRIVNKKYWSLLQSLFADNFSRALYLCAHVSSAQMDAVAAALLTTFDLANNTIPFLCQCIRREVDETDSESTLFRANSIVTKLLTSYMNQQGGDYLKLMMKELVQKLNTTEMEMEVDPNKLGKPTDDLRMNQINLMTTADQFIDRIINSIDYAPLTIREVAHHLQEIVSGQFPNARHSSVGGLLFLRFICPAVFTPHKSGLLYEAPLEAARRRFVLVTKILQNVANGVEFRSGQGGKEQYMIPMNPVITRNLKRVQDWEERFASEEPGGFLPAFRVVSKVEADIAEESFQLLADQLLLIEAQAPPPLNPALAAVATVVAPTMRPADFAAAQAADAAERQKEKESAMGLANSTTLEAVAEDAPSVVDTTTGASSEGAAASAATSAEPLPGAAATSGAAITVAATTTPSSTATLTVNVDEIASLTSPPISPTAAPTDVLPRPRSTPSRTFGGTPPIRSGGGNNSPASHSPRASPTRSAAATTPAAMVAAATSPSAAPTSKLNGSSSVSPHGGGGVLSPRAGAVAASSKH